MSRNVERILLLLAASGLSQRAIQDGVKMVEQFGGKEFVDRVMALRQRIQTSYSEMPYDELEAIEFGPRNERSEIANRVVELLLKETSFSTEQAVLELEKSLFEETLQRELHVRFRSKDGLRKWVERLMEYISPSVILHHATMIRNKFVHYQHADWPLRDRENE